MAEKQDVTLEVWSSGSSNELTETKTYDSTVQGKSPDALHRKLTANHLQFIALGSNVGTGLFIGTGFALRDGGPLALLLAFSLVTVVVYLMIFTMSEITVLFPITGGFIAYPGRFIDPALTFALGWQCWVIWAVIFATEATSFAMLISFWTDKIHTAALITIFIAITLSVHIFPVHWFGRVETFTSFLKLCTIIGFNIFLVVVLAGGTKNKVDVRTISWDNPGAITNGFWGVVSVFVFAAFACGGSEIIGMAGAETINPRHNIPRACNTNVVRMVFFYIITLILVTLVVSPNDLKNSGSHNASSSPFVIAAQKAGVPILGHIINGIILSCVASVGNCFVYSGARILLFLSQARMAPKFLGKVDEKGRPKNSLIITSVFSICLAYIGCSGSTQVVFDWLSRLIGMAFFIIWILTFISDIRLRKAIKAQNDAYFKSDYAFKQWGYPYTNIFGMVLVGGLIVLQLLNVIHPIGKGPDISSFFSNFLGAIIFVLSYLSYKAYNKQWFLCIPADEIDLQTNRNIVEQNPEDMETIDKYRRLNRVQRILSYFNMRS